MSTDSTRSNADRAATDSPIPTDAPTTTKYVYDASSAVNAYRSGAVRLDVVRKSATAAMMAAMIDDMDAAMVHRAVIMELDAIATAPKSSARVITATDYATATVRRVYAMANVVHELITTTHIPTDVPESMRADYVNAVRAHWSDWFDADGNAYDSSDGVGWWANDPTADDGIDYADDYKSAVAYGTARLIGSSESRAHYAAIRDGRAYDRHGAAFVPVAGTIYPFSVIANLRTTAYPNGDMSHGAAAAPFVKSGRPRDGVTGYDGWTYAAGPADAKFTHGVMFVGSTPTNDAATDAGDAPDA